MQLLHPADVSHWQLVYLAASGLEAGLVQGLLQQQRILVFTNGQYLAGAAGELPLTELGVRLLVPQQQYQEARAVIEQYLSQLKHEPAQWLCQCGELNYQSFEICWSCHQEHNETKSE